MYFSLASNRYIQLFTVTRTWPCDSSWLNAMSWEILLCPVVNWKLRMMPTGSLRERWFMMTSWKSWCSILGRQFFNLQTWFFGIGSSTPAYTNIYPGKKNHPLAGSGGPRGGPGGETEEVNGWYAKAMSIGFDQLLGLWPLAQQQCGWVLLVGGCHTSLWYLGAMVRDQETQESSLHQVFGWEF